MTSYVPANEIFYGLISYNIITQDPIDVDVDVWCMMYDVILMLHDNVIKEDTMYLDNDIWIIILLLSYDDLDINFTSNIDGSV